MRSVKCLAGDKITVLASKQATQGYEVFLQEGSPGAGTRSLSHDRDETFIVIEGDFRFDINEEEMTAEAGMLVDLQVMD